MKEVNATMVTAIPDPNDQEEHMEDDDDGLNPQEEFLFWVDMAYGVISRYGNSESPHKMVFKARDLKTGELCVLKLYTAGEQEDFMAEV